MSSGVSGSDEKLSGAKIQPLESEVKDDTPLDTSSRGATGSDRNIDQSRIEPIGGAGQYQHPLPQTHDGGSTGSDEAIGGAKIEPLEGAQGDKGNEEVGKNGLDDESVDGARVQPLGEVREEMS
ncbi:MAG: hypothetical protein M1827_003797 [Pycnora praestabilis]|nr:MAG: hypothetical protein M1827_003797 [Pycnora praestabilis]